MENLTEQIKIYSVSEITREVKALLEFNLPALWIEGEISNFIHHSSGHRYFTLKDENAQIKCVLWRDIGNFLKFEIEDDGTASLNEIEYGVKTAIEVTDMKYFSVNNVEVKAFSFTTLRE